MPVAPNLALLTSPNPSFFFPRKPLFTPQSSPKLLFGASSPWGTIPLRCSSEERDIRSLKEDLSGVLGKQVEELMRKEENRSLMEGLENASERVERAKKELAEIEKQEMEAKLLRNQMELLQTRVSEIAECQRELSEARKMVEEAERSLLLSMDEVGGEDNLEEKKIINKEAERWESAKAGLVSAVLGTVTSLPITLSQVTSSPQLILNATITFISCALFGITFRYTIRRDLDNIQLKTGTSAAFGLVKGLATVSGRSPLELNIDSFSSHAFDGVIYVSQNLFIFLFAAVGLDFCFKMRFLSPFPITKSSSSNKIS